MVAAKSALKKLRNSMIDEVAQEIVLDEVAKKAIVATGRIVTKGIGRELREGMKRIEKVGQWLTKILIMR